jgi:hypothetical protein
MIKISGHSLPAIYTKNKAQEIRVKNEIKFLYLKKLQLNRELYSLHLLNAHTWDNSWKLICYDINRNLNKEMEKKYKNMNNKIKILEQSQTTTYTKQQQQQQQDPHVFNSREVNYTNIQFTTDELMLLNKGLKYNLHHKPKNWLTKIALEAETAINLLYIRLRDYFRFLVAHNLQTLINKEHNTQHPNQYRIKKEKISLSKIKRKLTNNKARITEAGKGNSIVII